MIFFDALSSSKGRLFTFTLLYISEGIPLGFTTIAMVAYLRGAGIELSQIGLFTAALYLPWAFKWLWAPLIDLVKLQRFGGRKTWIITCTSLMIITLLFTATVDYMNNFQLLITMLIIHNVFCSTQDVAIDSLAVSTLKEDERAQGNGYMFAGQYVGLGLGGGCAMIVSSIYGFNSSLIFISVLMLLTMSFVIFFIVDPITKQDIPESKGNILHEAFLRFKTFIITLFSSFWKSGPGPKLGVVFAILPIGAMALAYATLSTLQVDYGFSEAKIGEISIYHTIFTAIGCVLGGYIGDKHGLKRSLIYTYILTAVPTLVLGFNILMFGLTSVDVMIIYSTIMAHALFFGMCFGLHAAIFMGLTNPAVAATQFTVFMALSNLVISFTNYWQGHVAERFGYAWVLFIDSGLVIIPILLIPLLNSRKQNSQVAKQQAQVVYSN